MSNRANRLFFQLCYIYHLAFGIDLVRFPAGVKGLIEDESLRFTIHRRKLDLSPIRFGQMKREG